MKTGVLIGVLFLALLAAVITIIVLVRVPNMYEVRGEADIAYTPDEAEITSSVYVENDVSLEAVQEAAATMRTVLAALKGAGIDDKEIKTATVQSGLLDESNERNRAPDAKRTYYAEQAVTVSIRNVTQVGKVLDAIARAGSNFWRVRYHLNEDRANKLQAEARRDALRNAIANADTYAREGNFTRGRVLKIQDEAVDFPEVDYPDRSYRTMHTSTSRRSYGGSDRVEKVTVTGTRISIPDSTFNIPPPREQRATATTHVLFLLE